MMSASVRDLRRWLADKQATACRERRELSQAGPAPAEAIRQALALIAFAGKTVGWPPPEDPVSRREDLLAYQRWARLRASCLER